MRGWRPAITSGKSCWKWLETLLALKRPSDYIAAMLAAPKRGGLTCFREIVMAQPLMPHATAAWLVDNSSLSFPQIADFCGLHILEVQAIADDTAATG